jgi:hypothetical protein
MPIKSLQVSCLSAICIGFVHVGREIALKGRRMIRAFNRAGQTATLLALLFPVAAHAQTTSTKLDESLR